MALKIVFLALLVYCASEAQSQGDGTSLPLTYDMREVITDFQSCPEDDIREEIKERVTSDIQDRLQDTVFSSLLLSQGWTRVAYLDMTNTSHRCPTGWRFYTTPRRACGRIYTVGTCRSVLYPTRGVSYSHICGRVIAYQYCNTDAFDPFNNRFTNTLIPTIDDVYVDGVSITHGRNPREHVWTFAAAFAESYTGSSDLACPCTNINNLDNPNIRIPPFVGDDYFCDSGTFASPGTCSLPSTFYAENPLWDIAGCSSTSTCCEFNNTPWFCKTLPVSQPVTDDIEVRICADAGSTAEDTPIELIELYVF